MVAITCGLGMCSLLPDYGTRTRVVVRRACFLWAAALACFRRALVGLCVDRRSAPLCSTAVRCSCLGLGAGRYRCFCGWLREGDDVLVDLVDPEHGLVPQRWPVHSERSAVPGPVVLLVSPVVLRGQRLCRLACEAACSFADYRACAYGLVAGLFHADVDVRVPCTVTSAVHVPMHVHCSCRDRSQRTVRDHERWVGCDYDGPPRCCSTHRLAVHG